MVEMLLRILEHTTEYVLIYIWNFRGIARVSFWLKLLTIRSLTEVAVIILTDIHAAA